MMFQNGRILDLMWNEEKGPSGKELEVNQVVEAYFLSKGKELSFTSLPSKFANFSSFFGFVNGGILKGNYFPFKKNGVKKRTRV